jgi:hypothetical protein
MGKHELEKIAKIEAMVKSLESGYKKNATIKGIFQSIREGLEYLKRQ